MLKPNNISFFRIMVAGYISAKTYRVISYYYTYYREMSIADIHELSSPMREELKDLYENDYVIKNLYFLEKIESATNIKNTIYFKHFENCLSYASNELKSLVSIIGKEVFVKNYLFNSPESVKGLYKVTSENWISVVHFKSSFFESLISKYYDNQTSNEEDCQTIQSVDDNHYTESEENICDDIITNNKGISENNDTEHLNDSTDINPDNIISKSYELGTGESCKLNEPEEYGLEQSEEVPTDINSKIYSNRYVTFLKSLSADEFCVFEEFLFKVLNKCSVRTINGIKYLGAREFYENYLFENEQKCLSIRNFGRKSLFELNSVKSQIVDFVISRYQCNNDNFTSELESNSNTDVFDKIDYSLREVLGENKYNLVLNELNTILESCSIRTQNGIRYYKGDFIEDFVHHEKNILSLKNIGRKSEIEIKNIINTLRNFISRIESDNYSQEDIAILKMKALLKNYFDEFAVSFYQEQGYLPMLHILDNMTKEIVKSHRLGILNEAIPLLEQQSAKSLDAIALTRDLSRERIRQIVALEQKNLSQIHVKDNNIIIPNYPTPIGTIENWEYVKQSLSKNTIWDIYDLRQLFYDENISLSDEYVLFFISRIFCDSYSIIGNSAFCYDKNSTWKNSYLINRNLVDAFDFNKMLDTVNSFEENSSNDITMSTQELVMDMFFSSWNSFDYTLVEDIKDVVAKVLISEKDIIPELDLRFCIRGQKKEETSDIIYRILLEFGNPMSIDLLFEQFNKLYPNKYKGSYSFTPIITNDPRMCFLGYNKLVTLNEWNHIKIGSIRDLLVQYLEQFDEPQHLNTIVEYIQQHRDTSENSIRTTMGSGDQFRIFACGFYGLSGKEYPEKFYLSESEQNSLSRFELIEEFIITNKRFPFFPADSKEEEQLSQWWYRINRQKNLHRLIQEKINWIIQTYGDLPQKRTDYTWYKQYNEYIAYVLKNNRKPEDIELSKWFNKTWNEISEGTLSKDKENAFIELCKKL